MDKAARRAAATAYKERPFAWGVFRVACADRAWVGASRHIDTQQNSLWFALRQGGCPNKAVQAAWNDAGADAFTFEVLEALPADTPDFRRVDLLKARLAAWREALGADLLA